MQHSIQLPKARKEKLIVKELADETLVYDLENDRAHCLNQTAASVWKHCDGTTTVGEIAASLSGGATTEPNENVVWLALDQLEEFQLLSHSVAKPMRLAGISRRQLMRTLGVAAVALPVIVSIVAPTPAAAVSCVNPGGRAPGVACGSPNQCCSNVCCTAATVPPCPNNTCQ